MNAFGTKQSPDPSRSVGAAGICWYTMLFALAAMLIVLTPGSGLSAAEVDVDVAPRLAHIFQDNMVLQRDANLPVWGWAAPGTEVQVTFAGQQKKAVADEIGYWKVALEPLAASSTGRDLLVKLGDTEIKRTNVLVGEVWLSAGQSNMNHAGPDTDTGVFPHYVSPKREGKPEIRIMNFGWGVSLQPLPDIDPARAGDAPWQTMEENPYPQSMSLPRYFARVLRDDLNVPVGIVHVAVSGTNHVAWMARQTLESFPGGDGHENYYQQLLAARQEAMAKSKGNIRSWEDFMKLQDQWRQKPTGQWPGRGNASLTAYPSVLYNTRVHPVAPFAMRGIIWHQGEAGPPEMYGERLVAMARQYREVFGQDLYFIWGTLSRNTNNSPPLGPQLGWFYRSNTNLGIRKALTLFGDDKRVALVEFYDVGDYGTHFLQKAEAGRRMGLAALTAAYGKDYLYTGPRMVEIKIDGNKATLRYEHTGKGISYQPSIDGISGFVVKGSDGPLRWAEVKVVDEQTLEVSHSEIEQIVTVAYGVTVNPHETVFNSDGLPASPFRHNTGSVPYHKDAVAMVRKLEPEGVKVMFNLAHVRRQGYAFQTIVPKAAAKVVVEAYISKEWDDYEVEIGGKAVETRESTRDGLRFAVFEAPADRSWIVVARKGEAAELRKINRY